MSKLTAKQEKFAQGVAKGLSQAAAYRAAYPASKKWRPKSVHECASQLAADTKVAPRIAELKGRIAEKACITAAEVLQIAVRIATHDTRRLYTEDGVPIPIHLIDDDTAAAIQGVDIEEVYAGSGADRVFIGTTKKYKVADKNSALEKLFKHFGLYVLDNAQKTDPLRDLLAKLSGNVVMPGRFEPEPGAPDDDDDDETGDGNDEG